MKIYIQCFIDGASRKPFNSDEMKAACATVIFKSGKEIVRFVRGLGNRTNNEAEYEALITTLLICSMWELPAPTIYSDSEIVVKYTNNKWECRNKILLPYYMTVRDLQTSYSFQIKQVPRKKVFLPDDLCNKFLDQQVEEERRLFGDP